MYSQFFGLNSPPFRITPDTEFFYSGGEREALIDAVVYAISHGDGIIKVVGEVGSGKTMLSRMLARVLPDNIVFVFLLNPSLQASDLVYSIGRDLGLDIDDGCSKNQALTLVQNKLLAMHAQQKRVVVFIDEAQCMPLETLEELRLLSNLETETDKLLQLVLFGQPELDEHLAHISVRQIKERIIHSLYLKPFTRAEVREYLSFRLHKAGYNGPPIFSLAALRLLAQYSRGLPRKLTILADKSLLAAFAAQSNVVNASHVRLAAKDSGQVKNRVSLYSMAALTLLLAILVIGVVLYNVVSHNPVLHSPIRHIQEPQAVVVPLLSGQALMAKKESSYPKVRMNQSFSKASRNDKMSEVDTAVMTLDKLTEKTQRWMAASPDAVYTIQILSAKKGDDRFLNSFFFNIGQNVGFDELYVYPVIVGDKTFSAVTIGAFSELTQASNYLNSLPAFIQRYKPYVKNITSFKH